MNEFLIELGQNSVLKLVCLFIVLDTTFGVLRAIKQRTFNSSFGIDGAIRKTGMIVSVLALFIADTVIGFNLLPFISTSSLETIGLEDIGLTEFFGLLFVIYESLSILKNMALIGLPVPKSAKGKLENWLSKFTDEVNKEKSK